MTSIYVNDQKIVAINPNDMSGNTGWLTTEDPIAEPITEEHGVPIYKFVNGHVANRTPEEIAADIPVDDPQPSKEEKLEAQILYTAAMTDTLIEEEA